MVPFHEFLILDQRIGVISVIFLRRGCFSGSLQSVGGSESISQLGAVMPDLLASLPLLRIANGVSQKLDRLRVRVLLSPSESLLIVVALGKDPLMRGPKLPVCFIQVGELDCSLFGVDPRFWKLGRITKCFEIFGKKTLHFLARIRPLV